MSIPINSLDDMRQALRTISDETRTALTSLSDHSGMARGVITRFASNRGKHNKDTDRPVDIYFGSLLKFINYAGYEVVVRKRDTRTQRQRARQGAAAE